jgi:hypothetical protein
MKKPAALTTLLEELKAENPPDDPSMPATAKAVIFTDEDAVDEEDGIVLDAEACQLIFASTDAVERLLDALNDPDYACISLSELSLSHKMLDFLERKFDAVDEG